LLRGLTKPENSEGASHLTKRERAAFDQRGIGIAYLGKARVLGVHIHRCAVLIDLTQHDAAFVMRAILSPTA
jgi:hypothetical protein